MSVLFISTWRDAGEPCVRKAYQTYLETRDLLTSCERGLVEVEMNPSFRAVGFGSLPNADGEQELDAGIMEGRNLNAGAVCAVRGIVPVISLARKVMENTPHIMLAGEQAKRFAERLHFQPMCLHSEYSLQEYEKWKREKRAAEVAHLVSDTVTIVGWESGNFTDGVSGGDKAHMVSACSTSGLAWKMPGRVGDSPIVGAGFYADDEAGAAGATGIGEDIWRFMLSYRAVENMRIGMSAKEACEDAIRRMILRKPETKEKCNVVFGVTRSGDWGAAASKDGFVAWVCRDGEIQSHSISGLS